MKRHTENQVKNHSRSEKNKKNEKNSKKSLNFCFYVVFWFMLIIFFTSAISLQLNRYKLYASEEAALVLKIEEQQKKEVQLKKDLNYHNSDAFVEKIARERWNFVRPDEYVFFNDAVEE